MNDNLLNIKPQDEVKKIISFVKETLSKQQKQDVVIGVSGGLDSVTCLYLLINSIPVENIHVLYLPYFENKLADAEDILQGINLSKKNINGISIKPIVDLIAESLNIRQEDLIRKGNVMTRVRMIMLFDYAKKINGLVCGTENKSEYYLGYFTRFGDEASDIEPLRQLYKTQVYELAKYLRVPQSVIEKQPSANLWEGQTDEEELGFSYKEADPVLYLYFDKKMSVEDIGKQGFANAKEIIDFAKKNSYKHHVPYVI